MNQASSPTRLLPLPDWLLAAGLGFAALATYFATMPRSITLEDAGLFQMVCAMGGIGHPPGYPLFTAGCQIISQLPIDPVLRGNLTSALFAAITVGLLFTVAKAVLGRTRSAVLVALLYAVSDTFWSQAIIIEVYSLAVMMFLLTWLLTLGFVRTASGRYWFGAALCAGLSLTNHWPLMLLSAPALIATLYPAREQVFALLKSPAVAMGTVLCFSVGLTPYLTILLNSNPPIAVYGAVQSFEDLIGYVARRTYSDHHVGAGLIEKMRYGGWLLAEAGRQFGIVLAPLVALGAVVSFRRIPVPMAWVLVLMFAGSTLVLATLIGFRYTFFYQAIFKPYPVIAFLACAFWIVLAAEWLLERLKADTRAQFGICVLLPVLAGVANLPGNCRADARFVDGYAHAVLEGLEQNAIIFLNGDNQVGPIGFLHHVDGLRPDVEVRDWENLVFENRLRSPFSPLDFNRQAVSEYVGATTRPVYSMEPWLEPAINYGLFYRFDRAGKGGIAFDPAADRFLEVLLDLWEHNLLSDPHERYHAFHLLIGFGRQYAGYVVAGGSLDSAAARRFERLQQTFAGKLMLLEAFNHQPWREQDGEAMVALARSAEPLIPPEANVQSRAVFKEFAARSHMRAGDLVTSERLFVESFELFPVAHNTSICGLHKLFAPGPRRPDPGPAAAALLSRFPSPSC